MKHLLFALVFSQLAFAQPDVNGIESALNYPQSLFQLQKDAQNGIPEAQYNLALIYDKGTGVPQSYEKSFEWFLKSANSGFDSGQFALGYMYLHGHGRDKNIVEAEKWFLKAALQGHARSQFTLGLIYDVGEGVDRSVGKSYFWHYIAMLNDYLEAPGMVKYMAEKMTAEEIDKSKNAAIKCLETEYQLCEV